MLRFRKVALFRAISCCDVGGRRGCGDARTVGMHERHSHLSWRNFRDRSQLDKAAGLTRQENGRALEVPHERGLGVGGKRQAAYQTQSKA